MTEPADELFGQLQEEANYQQQLIQQQKSYELRIVKLILSRAGLAASTEDGERPDMIWFHATYSQFPVRLFTAKIPYVHETKWQELHRQFFRTRFFNAYKSTVRTHDIDEREEYVGLVFPIINWGNLILHNHYQGDRLTAILDGDESSTFIIRARGKPPIVYVLEEFDSFLAVTGTTWHG